MEVEKGAVEKVASEVKNFENVEMVKVITEPHDIVALVSAENPSELHDIEKEFEDIEEVIKVTLGIVSE